MKVIGILPFKNEEKFLPTYLSNVQPICDEIIAVDDHSTDNSRQIMEDAGVIVKGYEDTEKLKGGWTCGLIRQHLFNYAREAGGTHFVCLDADETFTSNFVPIARDIMSQLEPGEKVHMQWLALWKSYTAYRDDHTVWSRNFKDFIVADHPDLDYSYNYMCEGRTIGPNNNDTLRTLEVEHGGVLHYQFACFNNFLLKQAWCQVGELVRDALQIKSHSTSQQDISDTINQQWESNKANNKGLEGKSICCVCDVSGSMECDEGLPLYNAIGLSIRISELVDENSGFKNRRIKLNGKQLH